jgi:hypothetical protein
MRRGPTGPNSTTPGGSNVTMPRYPRRYPPQEKSLDLQGRPSPVWAFLQWLDKPKRLVSAGQTSPQAVLTPCSLRIAPDKSPFAGFTADRLRTAIGRACKATGTPVFSPHDLRHRRATLWHLGGVPASQAAAWLGHSAQEHLRTYAHVMIDRTELDYGELLRGLGEPTRDERADASYRR